MRFREWRLVFGGTVCGAFGFAGRVDLNEERLGAGEDGAGIVEDARFSAVFAAVALDGAGLDANGCERRDGAEVLDFKVAGHGGKALGADGFAHGFVKESGDYATVKDAAGAFKCVGDGGQADYRAIVGEEKFEAQAAGVGVAAAEAAVLCGVG